MKGHHDKIFLATKGRDYANPNNNDFDILLTEPPKDGKMYKEYVSVAVVNEMLNKLRLVCGHRAMRYVDKQIEIIKGTSGPN